MRNNEILDRDEIAEIEMAPSECVEMTEDDFSAQYPLIPNHLNRNGGAFEGCLFDTTAEELAFVEKQNPCSIWTWVDDMEGGSVLLSGCHFCNRLGYLLSTNPFPEFTDITVELSKGDGDDEDDDEDEETDDELL